MNSVLRKKSIYKYVITLLLFSSLLIGGIYAATDVATTLNQTINAAALSIAIVDDNGDPVVTPSVSFTAFSFSFEPGNSPGILGTSTQKIRVSNPTMTAAWSVSIAATEGESAVWSDGGTNSYAYNHATDADLGRLTVNAATNGVVTPASGCSNTNVTKGSSATFVHTTTPSITILSAIAGADTLCYWDLTAVDLTQRIPASQAPASYSLSMTLSIM